MALELAVWLADVSWLGVRVLDTTGFRLLLTDGAADPEGVPLALRRAVRDSDMVGVAVDVSVAVGVPVELAVGVPLSVALAVNVTVLVALLVALGV